MSRSDFLGAALLFAGVLLFGLINLSTAPIFVPEFPYFLGLLLIFMGLVLMFIKELKRLLNYLRDVDDL